MPKCPGQDPQFWKPEDVAEVPCADCGYTVEFFKTDVTLRCPRCRRHVTNPTANTGCAQWCTHAPRCLGFDTDALALPNHARQPRLQQLVWRLRLSLGPKDPRFLHALRALKHAHALLTEHTAQPRRVLAAVLLHVEPTTAADLMKESGFATDEAEDIQRAASQLHECRAPTARELNIARQADLRTHEEEGLKHTTHASAASEGIPEDR